MTRLRLGVVAESFGVRIRTAFRMAAEIGIGAVEVEVGSGDLAPRNFTQTGRRDFRHALSSRGLELAAVSASFGRGISEPTFVQEAVERLGEIVRLATDLDARVVVANLGQVAADDEDSIARTVVVEALAAIGRHAEDYDRVLALQVGAEPVTRLRQLIESAPVESLRVCVDPASTVVRGLDPVETVHDLADLVAHVHIRDGLRTGDGTPRIARMGEGAVPFAEFLASMAEIGYEGYFVIDYRGSPRPAEDVAQAKEFLERL